MGGRTLICADVGNSRTKVAVADKQGTWRCTQAVTNPELLELESIGVADWAVVSVNQPRLASLRRWVADLRGDDRVSVLEWRDFPMRVNVELPERLGVDRLAAAYAATRLKRRSRDPIIVINVGTAVTIDLVDADDCYQGGVIFPGPHTSFQALSRATAQLPDAFIAEIPEAVLGKQTAEAIRCGVWQMQIGAIREIVGNYRRLWRDEGGDARGEVFLTGGGAGPLESKFGTEFRVVADLVLQGVRFASEVKMSEAESGE
jgi:type III pantothenate kinase